ncbi:acetylornithine deacetylase [Vibrio sp. FJH11]
MPNQNTLDILSTLISYDTTSAHSNMPLIDYIQTYLGDYGIESTLVFNHDKNKANLFASIGPKDKAGIMLSGHTDTVPVTGQQWDTNPFELVIDGERCFGRGTTDMKSFLAVVLAAIPDFLARPLHYPVHFAFSYDEEIGCLGVRGLIEQLQHLTIKPAACIVGEPTSMKVATRHKGKLAAKVTITGKSCHSGMAPYGVNAVNYAARLVNWLENMALTKRDHGPFNSEYEIPYTTIHTGTIHGGQALNIVPDLCQFDFEMRNIASDDPVQILSEFQTYAQQLVVEMRKVSEECDISIDILTEYPGLDTSENTRLITYVQNLAQDFEISRVNFGTEGGLFSQQLKIPTLVCGPGNMEQGHKPNEYITYEQLEKAEAFIHSLAHSLSNDNFI